MRNSMWRAGSRPPYAILVPFVVAWVTCRAVRAQNVDVVSCSGAGVPGDGASYGVLDMTPDARYVAFQSYATNLAATPDTNGMSDIFVKDRVTGAVELVSVSTAGVQGNQHSVDPSISADGRYVVFTSMATNLLAVADANGTQPDVFVRDRVLGTTQLVSCSASGVQGDRGSSSASISSDGRYVLFVSAASNLVASDQNGHTADVFLRDLQTGTVEIVDLSGAGVQAHLGAGEPSMSADARYVVFVSEDTNLVVPDANGVLEDVFLRDRQLGTTERVSLSSAGVQADGMSEWPTVSADGRCVAFQSAATNLGGMGGPNAWYADVFVRDRSTGTTELVSQRTDGAFGNNQSFRAAISTDGRYVVFSSLSSNLAGALDFEVVDSHDVFLRDRLEGTTELVSLSSTGADGNSFSLYARISGDGTRVAFCSAASNLVQPDANGVADVFVRDRSSPPILAWCFPDNYDFVCPCGNTGLPERGCQNSAGTGGARLVGTGVARLSSDSLVLATDGELPSALTVFFLGTGPADGSYGDGIRCAGGSLKRLYVKTASGGVATAPQPGDPSITARCAALGSPIPLGAMRHIQAYYRDPNSAFCPPPYGSTWNVTNAVTPFWAP